MPSAALMYDQLEHAQRSADRHSSEPYSANKTDANTLTQYAQWLIKTGDVQTS